ncbi:nucleolar protein 9 [Phlebotomus argentipes]|uniref:nucleolar protein 9 n=1 Tax=Phlebotomus argentipes TaxID=94469 RepID=UPI002892F28D|nr:nucleolar protein 9 [Phlebotomus argentipes]
MKKREIKRKHIRKSVKNYLRSKEHIPNQDISEEDAKYFLGILNVLQEDSEVESKELLATNVIEFTRGREVLLASHQIASKVIENLLEHCSDDNLAEYQKAFKEDIRTLCANRFSSHVLEKLISVSAVRALRESTAEEPPEKKMKEENQSKFFVESCSKFLLNNLEEFVWDTYANHVIRTCLKSLSGEFCEGFQVPEAWRAIAQEFVSRLRDWPFFSTFPYSELTSGLLQALVTALQRIDKNSLKSLGGFFTEEQSKEEENEKKLHKLFSTESSIRFLEVLIASAGKKLFTKIFLRLFQGNFLELSLLKSANFSVQKILEKVENKDEFSVCFGELEGHFGEILQIGHTGVILSLCQACKRLEMNQHQFVRGVRKALECPKEGNLVTCILKLKPHEKILEDSSTFIHLHGSLILQDLLNFRKPIEIIQSVLAIAPDQLVGLLNTAKGSFIVDAFFSSPHVGEKSRVAFVKHLQNFYIDLAVNKFGSRTVERLFEASAPEVRQRIVAELTEKMNKLQSTQFGFIVSKKLHVEEFKQSQKRWIGVYGGNVANKKK